MTLYQLDNFTRAYIEAALWTATDAEGEPLDAVYSSDDFSSEALIRAAKDCAEFQALAADLLRASDYDDKHAGHDFSLTRNGHGAGFWEGDYCSKEIGEALTKISQTFGNTYVFENDGILYFEGGKS